MVVAWVYAVGLLILGFTLILLEIFVIPGINVFGVLGFVTVAAGVAYAYFALGLWEAAAVAVLGLVGTAVLLRALFGARGWRRLVLHSATSRELGYTAGGPGRQQLVGQRGEALTQLRPAGRARFGDDTVDVVTEGAFVERGARVEVLRVAGSRVVVQSVLEAAGAP
jgi:membrane-bound serine protease (ClpP class)